MRSKVLLAANILATIYAGVLLYWIGGYYIELGGLGVIKMLTEAFSILSALSADAATAVTVLYVVYGLLIAHISLFTLGALLGWLSYFAKKSGLAKFAAVLYLIGTICFPIYILFGLPIIIVGFIGGGKQKALNKAV